METKMLRRNILTACFLTMLVACGSTSSPTSSPGNCQATVPAACPATPPNYTADIAPIIENTCSQCHAPGGVAAAEHPLDTYSKIYSQRAVVEQELAHCNMPAPGAAHPMTDADRETVLTWLACNAPQSATSPAPGTNPNTTTPGANPNTTSPVACATTDTWSNFGEQFFATNCAGCHGAGHQPGTEFFDPSSYSSVMKDASDIADQIQSGSMPKNATLDAGTKQRILAWLSCNPQPF